ncbi:hypothetical protein [Mangrovibacterium diazotrophicum]|uniref:Outer membrane protein with beta-barrel domain n=1 Tax=Mangrovibacterium diazotrophicum TaxID=1261403 RepID=A0A419VWE1_9BACT|nr:hypothetical protein [Mangrovibacterium diazotrophicum]RKD86477.1 hypothetical protein BC643_4170 [Mangrovibacterium diazotrophicum]
MNSKNIVLILILIGCSFPLSILAQDTQKHNEVGLRFSNLDNFGLTYKFGNQELRYRLSGIRVKHTNANINDTYEYKMNSWGAGLAFGIEKPVTINQQLDFYYGLELEGIYDKYKYDNEPYASGEVKNYWAYFNFIAGLSYRISDQIKFSAELTPAFYYNKSDTYDDEQTRESFGFGLSNDAAVLTLSYCF